MTIAKQYPGRQRVLNNRDAADIRFRQEQAVWEGRTERFPCERPYIVHAIGLPSMLTPDGPKIPLDIQSRCRKCAACLRHRRRLWTARAIDECKASTRTWFATLTYHPEARFIRQMQAATLAKQAGHGEWRDLDSDTKFAWLSKSMAKDVTDWLKRVRKSGGPFRYLLVAEAHKDGYPHYHLLIHEGTVPLRKRMLEEKWRFGHSHFRLVNTLDAKTAVYVCKYLTKSSLSRVRGSLRYGRDALLHRLTVAVKTATQSLTGNPHP